MLISLKDYIQDKEDNPISESIISKGFAIAQQRKHAANAAKLQAIASRIQSNARKGMTEDDPEKRSELLFTLFADLASALKITSQMSTNSINVSTVNALFAESVRKELQSFFSKNRR